MERVARVAKRTEWSFITVTQGQYCFWLNLARKAPGLGSASCKLLAKGTDKGREKSARKEPLHSSFTPTPNCPAEQSRAAGLKIKGGGSVGENLRFFLTTSAPRSSKTGKAAGLHT